MQMVLNGPRRNFSLQIFVITFASNSIEEMPIRLKGGRLIIKCYQMKIKVRGWHYGAHKETFIDIDGPSYWENTGGRRDMFEAVQRYLGPSWEVTSVEHYGD